MVGHGERKIYTNDKCINSFNTIYQLLQNYKLINVQPAHQHKSSPSPPHCQIFFQFRNRFIHQLAFPILNLIFCHNKNLTTKNNQPPHHQHHRLFAPLTATHRPQRTAPYLLEFFPLRSMLF